MISLDKFPADLAFSSSAKHSRVGAISSTAYLHTNMRTVKPSTDFMPTILPSSQH